MAAADTMVEQEVELETQGPPLGAQHLGLEEHDVELEVQEQGQEMHYMQASSFGGASAAAAELAAQLAPHREFSWRVA